MKKLSRKIYQLHANVLKLSTLFDKGHLLMDIVDFSLFMSIVGPLIDSFSTRQWASYFLYFRVTIRFEMISIIFWSERLACTVKELSVHY